MKFFRHGSPGAERPGLVDANGHLRDLTAVVPDISGAILSPSGLSRLRGVDPAALPMVGAESRIGPCVAGVRNFFGIGLNFHDHAKEAGLPIPDYPLVFNKAVGCVAGSSDVLRIPPGSRQLDYEIELAVVLSQDAWQLDAAASERCIGGYCLSNDITDRFWQNAYSGQWTIAKSGPGFGPIGPFLVTPDEIPNLEDLSLELTLNGELRQKAKIGGQIFKAPEIISYLSKFIRLNAGDLITMGTPAGVGLATGRYLLDGDRIVADGGVLGRQRILVQAPD